MVRLSNWLYRLKCKYWNKYSTVKPKTLKDTEYQPLQRLMSHCIFEILDRANLKSDDELSRINYWWKCIFLPKSRALVNNIFNNKTTSKRFMRKLNQSDILMQNFKVNLRYIIDNMERIV